MKSVKKEYTNGEVTIVWKNEKCIHSGNCVRGLPDVFDPNARPWINIEGASTEALVEQVKKCPSAALSYYFNDLKEETMETENNNDAQACLQIFENGPVKLDGPVKLTYANGDVKEIDKDVFLCRCGHSTNKPFCDGSHKKEGFEG